METEKKENILFISKNILGAWYALGACVFCPMVSKKEGEISFKKHRALFMKEP
jgi:hypothetical protein